MPATLKLAAPAKLNLYLRVTGKRADGYHLLDGLAAFADIHDTLEIAPADTLTFSASGPFADALGDDMSSNLVVKAALALADATGRRPDFAFSLTKILPVASGIGGGSADAAACLRGLARLWGLDALDPILLDVAARLGSDIPVCVTGRAVFMGGIGTELAPAPKLPPAWLVLVNPGVALSTPSVYRARSGAFSQAARFDDSPADARELASRLALRGNDLTAPAMALVPRIGAVLAAIGSAKGCLVARMSGSGATCFGIFDEAETAAAAAAAIADAHPGWWVKAGRLLEDANILDG